MGHSDKINRYIWLKLWDILSENNGISKAKTKGYIRQNYWIYLAKTMGYNWQKLWDIFGKNYEIY